MGEGESTIEDMLEGIFNNNILKANGIAYRDRENHVVTNWDNTQVCNLDELPMIKFTDTCELYQLDIEVGRGGPFNCTFCATKTFWGRRFKLKTIDRLIKELKYYQERYKIQ